MHRLSPWLPGVFAVLVTLAAALPWPLPEDYRLLQPLLPYLAIHFAAERRSPGMPDWLAFLCGLVTDALGQGPLGYWSLVYVTGHALVRALVGDASLRPFSSIATLALVLAALGAEQWLVSTAYLATLAPLMPIARATLVALAIYAIAVWMLPSGRSDRRLGRRLERGS